MGSNLFLHDIVKFSMGSEVKILPPEIKDKLEADIC